MMFEISSSPVRAVIVTHALMSVPAFVMKIFEPVMIQLPSRNSAVVRVAPASDPAPGSVNPNAASFFPDARLGSACRGRARLRPARLVASRSRGPSAGRAGAPRRGRSSTGEALRELDDEPDAEAGAAALCQVVPARAFEEAGARHVYVRPRTLAREFAEELRRKRRRGLLQLGRVLEIGVIGADVTPEAAMQRERPQVIAAALRGGEDLLPPRVVVREQSAVEVAECKLHRAGQRRD